MNVSKVYKMGEVETHAVKDISLEIKDGQFVVLQGPSGSGKSTMLNICSGLDKPTSGIINIDDEVISNMNSKELTKFRRDNLGFIFQQYNLLQTLSVKENVEVGREVSLLPFTVEEVLEQVGLSTQTDKYPFQLSGGEQQRVSIARAVVKNPKIMFCDEPTGALDEDTAKEILGVLQKLNETYKTTIVLITHNPSIGAMADRIIKLNSGEIVEDLINKSKLDASDISWG
jgi:putative ABC transport system ATP-binding protein